MSTDICTTPYTYFILRTSRLNIRIATDTGIYASLRGRPLKGLELQLPSGYAGEIYMETLVHRSLIVCCLQLDVFQHFFITDRSCVRSD